MVCAAPCVAPAELALDFFEHRPVTCLTIDASYLSMDGLANLVHKAKDPAKEAGLSRVAKEYKPIRDAVAHTALLTDAAKGKLTTVRENIKGRVKTILSKKK